MGCTLISQRHTWTPVLQSITQGRCCFRRLSRRYMPQTEYWRGNVIAKPQSRNLLRECPILYPMQISLNYGTSQVYDPRLHPVMSHNKACRLTFAIYTGFSSSKLGRPDYDQPSLHEPLPSILHSCCLCCTSLDLFCR